MKKLLITCLVLLFTQALTGNGAFIDLTQTTNSITDFEGENFQDYRLEKKNFNNPFVNEWRSTVDQIELNNFEFKVERNKYLPLDIESKIQLGDEILSSDIILDGPPDPKKHPPINIDSEKDLRKFPGSGTVEDPYIIEGFYISHSKKNLIQIKNLDVYIEIRHNFLDGQNSGNVGILLNNVKNIKIHNNFIFSNGFGILISNSMDIQVDLNDIYNNAIESISVDNLTAGSFESNNITLNGNGLFFANSNSLGVTGNTVYENDGNGITLVSTTSSLISYNEVHHNTGDGIFLQDSNNNIISYNIVYSNGVSSTSSLNLLSKTSNSLTFHAGFGGAGIFLDPSFGNTVSNNAVYENSLYGIYLEESGDTTIEGNDIYSNDFTGIFFFDSNNNDIINNQIHDNGDPDVLNSLATNDWELITHAGFGGAGIFLDPSDGNTISGNDIFGNYGDGLVLEYSSNTNIFDNDIDSNGFSGIFFLNSDSNSILENTVTNNGLTVESLGIMSTGSSFEKKLMAGFGGAGIFLDPSDGNVIDNNLISNNVGVGLMLEESTNSKLTNNDILSNGGEGVFLMNSAENEISNNAVSLNGYDTSSYFSSFTMNEASMELFAGFGGAGIFLDPSPNNVIFGNVISENAASGIYFLESDSGTIVENTIQNNGGHGIFFQNSNNNIINSNRVNSNGHSLSAFALGLDAGFGGAGIFLDPSIGNQVSFNNVSSNAAEGILVENTDGTTISDNRFLNNGDYGVEINGTSSNSVVQNNNLEFNGGINAQARDDGSFNSFTSNYYSDLNSNDTDLDGFADDPYLIDGEAENVEDTALAIKNGLNFYNVTMETSPRKINADSEGTPVTIKVFLADNYRVLNISLDKLWLNGTINPYNYHIIDLQTFTVTFERSEINNLLNSLGLEPPFFAVLELTGRINEGLLDITGYDTVEVNQTDDTMTTVLIAGSMGLIPISSFVYRRKEE